MSNVVEFRKALNIRYQKDLIKQPSQYVLNAKAALKAFGCTDISERGTACTFNGKRYFGNGISTAEMIGDMISRIGKDYR